jgi:aromatic ring-opening dioxygenase catalytic subunit (LigB family)
MPDAAPPELKKKVYDGFDRMRSYLEASKPDAIVCFSSEHVVNLTPSNAAQITIGTGRRYSSREEPFNLGTPDVPGAAELGYDMAEFALERDFDLAHSVDLTLDHGTVLPLHFITPDFNVPIVLVLINTQFGPMAKMSRCYDLGKVVGEFLEGWGGPAQRVALLATGGLSHHVGQRQHGIVHEDFDRPFMEHLLKRDNAPLARITQEEIDAVGNGTNEIRNWMTFLGAIPGDPSPRAITQEWFIPNWATGGHQVVWE